MNVSLGVGIFLMGASCGALLQYIRNRDMLRRYSEHAKQSIAALQDLVGALKISSVPQPSSGLTPNPQNVAVEQTSRTA